MYEDDRGITGSPTGGSVDLSMEDATTRAVNPSNLGSVRDHRVSRDG